MKTFYVEIEGITPLMHHRMPEDELFALLGTKTKKSKDIEERTPREIADRYAYKNTDGIYYIPTEYIVGAFKHVAGDYKQSNKGKKTMKGIAAGIFRPCEAQAILFDKENKPITSFEVDIRKATNHQKGAIAVCRPRFDQWRVKTHIAVDDSLVSTDMCLQILQDSGKRSGIGSFRVQRGGIFGQFNVIVWKELKE